MENRAYDIRAANTPLTLEGVAVVFDQPAQVGGVTETIARGALDGVDLSDVVLLTNHDGAGVPLARTPKTLTLTVTETGLSMRAELPDTEQGRGVYEAVKRGDLSQMSFAFDIAASDFDEQTRTRTITAISRVYEISVVNFAAYTQTTVQARNDAQKGNEPMNTFNPVIASLDAQTPTADTHAVPEYRTAFYKSLLGKELTESETRAMTAARAEKRADSFNTLSNSAAVVPTQTLNEVISQAEKQTGLWGAVRLFNVPSNLSIPIGTPTDPAQWHVEGSAVDRKDVTTAAVTFAGYELIKILSMSAAVKRMSVAAFESYITRELSRSVTDAISAAIVGGTGTGQPTGILTGIIWDDENSIEVNNMKASDLLDLIALLQAGYAGNAKFAMSNATLFSKVYPLLTGTGEFIFANPESGGYNRLFGFEIVIDDNIPMGTILFGNFKYYGANVPESIAIEVSRDSGFTSGLIDFRALCIADGKPIMPGAFVKLETDSE